jgi:hypothetical protein
MVHTLRPPGLDQYLVNVYVIPVSLPTNRISDF